MRVRAYTCSQCGAYAGTVDAAVVSGVAQVKCPACGYIDEIGLNRSGQTAGGEIPQ